MDSSSPPKKEKKEDINVHSGKFWHSYKYFLQMGAGEI